jgi:NTE family protein
VSGAAGCRPRARSPAPVGTGTRRGDADAGRCGSDAGLDVTDADLIVGTSAGSVVGTVVASGQPLDALYARQLTPSDGGVERAMTQLDIPSLTAIFSRWAGAAEMTPAVRAEIGALALAAPTAPEDDWLAAIAALLGVREWPARRLLVTAVDAADGTFQAWERDAGVELVRAVASSCAVPGMFPPVTISGRRYMDGGVRSVTNADLARGAGVVLVIAPIGASAEGLGAVARRHTDAEVAALRAAGSRVEVVLPDAAALAAFGPNLMDPQRRAAGAEAGRRQGAALAAGLRAPWAGEAV